MTKEIKNLLIKIQSDRLFNDFYFVGGTALSYYLNHRISYDLDFISLSHLKTHNLKTLIVKFNAGFIPDQNASVFKINSGENIEKYKMMFMIDKVKIEFFYPNDPIREEIVKKYSKHSKYINQNIKILPIEAIAQLKVIALFRRNKIRDLFDVYVLLEHEVITVDLLERFYSAEIAQSTLVEFIEVFKDDGSESLDFSSENRYYNDFSMLAKDEKTERIKQRIVELLVDQAITQKEYLR